MKKILFVSGLLFASTLAVLLNFSCSNSSDSASLPDSANPSGSNEDTQSLMYFDEESGKFKGTASWTAKTIHEKVLLG